MTCTCLLAHSKKLSLTLNNISLLKSNNIFVYNVYDYAWDAWKTYIETYAKKSVKFLLLGINPGPHGMVQTGIPFGNISTVRDWLKIDANITQPKIIHSKRPILGLSYHKEEPSGKLLWQCIKARYPQPQKFFKDFFVLNYCPLAFFDNAGINLTPDKLPLEYKKEIEIACTTHLEKYLDLLSVSHIFAIGRYAAKKASNLLSELSRRDIQVHYLTHPSPLNPKHKQFSTEFNTLLDTLLNANS